MHETGNIPGGGGYKILHNEKNDGRAMQIHNRIMAGALYFHCFPAREELTVPDRRL